MGNSGAACVKNNKCQTLSVLTSQMIRGQGMPSFPGSRSCTQECSGGQKLTPCNDQSIEKFHLTGSGEEKPDMECLDLLQLAHSRKIEDGKPLE